MSEKTMQYGTRISKVRIRKLNMLQTFLDDQRNGLALVLKSTAAYQEKPDKFTKKKEKVPDGLQSSFFGSTIGDDREYEDRYSCKCKKMIGKKYEGRICDSCGSMVEFIDIDLRKFGYIVIDNYSVLTPIYYQKLVLALGKMDGENVLDKILEVSYEENGHQKFTEKEMLQLSKHPYIHKGMIWLEENIEEVLDYYMTIRTKTNKHMKKLFMELYNGIPDMFTSHIAVRSALLRTELPGEKDNKLYKLKINTTFQSIIRLANFINDIPVDDIADNETTINIQLAAIQKELEDVFTSVYNSWMKKQGIIYSKILGGEPKVSAPVKLA